jgi:hypothetical protein
MVNPTGISIDSLTNWLNNGVEKVGRVMKGFAMVSEAHGIAQFTLTL